MCHKCLFCPEFTRIDGILHLAQELLVHVVHAPGLKPEAGGIADVRSSAKQPFSPLYPIVDHAESAWQMVEKHTHVANDHLINVKE
jgi:hypothetical protein